MSIAENIAAIREEIAAAAKACGRQVSDIKLMGVTKYHPVEMMTEAVPFIDVIGENKVQEAYEKRSVWPEELPSVPWHMIGHLQRNKVRRALASFDLIESLDSRDLASALNRVLAEEKRNFPVFVEINISRESAKSGVTPEDVPSFFEYVLKECPFLSIKGLMTVAEDTDDEKVLHKTFADLREIRDKINKEFGLALSELSMGMSGDFKIAIAEGSTIVRIGSAIFGPRDYGVKIV